MNSIQNKILDFNGITDPFDREILVSGSESLGSASQFFDVSVLGKMIDEAERVFVHADYDADGISSAAIVRQYLPDCEIYVPERSDGYGVSEEVVQTLTPGTLLITVDCGIKSGRILDNAPDGVTVVVTDHHEPHDGSLSKKWPIANPLLAEHGFRGYSGSGVIYTILRDLYGDNDDAIQFAAIGTVCDVMPMVSHNRKIVRDGINSMRSHAHPGVFALCKKSGVYCGNVNEEDIGWKIGPAINASGRMGDVGVAVSLFNDPYADHGVLSSRLVKMNKERRKVVDEIYSNQVATSLQNNGEIVYAVLEDVQPGMIGLVAGKLLRTHELPSVAISLSDGVCHASMRAPKWFNAVVSLSSCSKLLLSHGGHAAAAGFSFKIEDLDSVMKCLSSFSGSQKRASVAVHIQSFIEMGVDEVVDEYDNIRSLAPYGNGFRQPIFLSTGLVSDASNVGDRTHLKCKLDGHNMIFFGANIPAKEIDNTSKRVMYTVSENRFAGKSSIQLMAQEIT